MNNHWIIPLKTENQSKNDFYRKIGFHNQIGGVSQPYNKDITQFVGLDLG